MAVVLPARALSPRSALFPGSLTLAWLWPDTAEASWGPGASLLAHTASLVLLLLVLALAWTRATYTARLRSETRGRLATDAALQRTDRALRALTACNRAVIQATEERALLARVCRVLVDTEGYPLAWVGYAEEGGGRGVRRIARAGADDGPAPGREASGDDDPADAGPAGQALAESRPVVVADILADRALAGRRRELARRGYRSVAALPLLSHGRAFAVLVIHGVGRDAFDGDSLGVLEELAGNLAHGIGALRLRADQRRGEQRLWVSSLKQAVLNRVLRLAFEPLSLQQQLQRTLREALSLPWLPLGGSGVVALSASDHGRGPLTVSEKACETFRQAVVSLAETGGVTTALGLAPEGARLACAACQGGERPFLPYCWVPIRSGHRLLGVLALTLTADCDHVPDLGAEQEFLLALGSTLATIVERKENEEKLRLLATVFDSAAEGIMVTDARNRIVAVNDAFCGITGYPAEEVVGRTPRFLRSDRHDDEFYRRVWQAIARDGRWQGEIWNRRKSGEVYPEWLSITVIRDDAGAPVYHIGVFTDISMLKQSQARFEYLAHHDALTGLPNRLLLSARLEQAMHRANRERNSVGLLFLDLDRFKEVNDRFGHLVGDQLLQGVAERLTGSVREQDTVARLAGDEFVVILEGLAEPLDAALVARKVLDALGKPVRAGAVEVTIGSSIGIALYPADAHDPATLLRHADQAMYAAKQLGRGTYAFFDSQPEAVWEPAPARRCEA